MKKLIIIASTIICFSVVACNNSGQGTHSSDTTGEGQPRPVQGGDGTGGENNNAASDSSTNLNDSTRIPNDAQRKEDSSRKERRP